MSKFWKNIFYQGSFQILKVILPIITIPIVSNALGSEGIGAFNFVNSIVSYFLLIAGLGMDMYGIREIAIVRDDKKKLSKKFWELELFNLFCSLGTLIVYIIFSLFLPDSNLFLIQSLIIVGALFDITWFFSGIEDFRAITISSFIIKILGFLAILLLVKDTNDLVTYFWIQSLNILVTQLILWLFIFKRITFVKVNFTDIISHLRPATNFFLGKIATTIYMNVNRTFLGILGTVSMVGIYSNSINVIFLVVTLAGTADAVLLPMMSNLQAKGESKKMLEVLSTIIHLELFITIFCTFSLITVSNQMVEWFFGESFLEAKIILPLLAPIIIIKVLGTAIVKQYLMPKNQIKEFNISVITGAIINVVLNVLLIPFIGIYGAVISTIMTELFVTGMRVRSLVNSTNFKFKIKEIVFQIISGILTMLIIYILTRSFPANILVTIIQGTLCIVLFLVFTSLFRVNPLVSIFQKFLKNKIVK